MGMWQQTLFLPLIQELLGRFGSEVGSVLEAVRLNAFSGYAIPTLYHSRRR